MKNKSKSKSTSSFLVKLVYFFPLQLLFVHLKKNLQLLLFWLLLLLIIFQQIGVKYGIPYLFIAPEYLGELSFWSYFIVGFSIGGFVTAFNISSYIMNGFRFPFLATLSNPFYKYSINNSALPALFIVSYIFNTFVFLSNHEDFTDTEIIVRIFGFLLGYAIFILLSTLYFLGTNKDFEKLFGKDLGKVISSDTTGDEPAKLLLQKKDSSWYSDNRKTWRIESYLGGRLQLKTTRPFDHYDRNMLSQVFRQNHINASFFQIIIIISIIILGLFRENELFIIPAGATIILLLTTLIMITSAIRSWTHGWSLVVIISLLLFMNQLSKHYDFYYSSKAYGMSYDQLADYKNSFQKHEEKLAKEDLKLTYEKLNNWKQKHITSKPKAVFIATSGGGSRAAFWSYLALSHLDSVSQGKLMNRVIMGTGSSGGMIGLSYYRALYMDDKHKKRNGNLAKDILNPVVFTLAVNDILIRTQRFTINGESHWKDRGYIFEQTLNKNTNDIFQHDFGIYQEAEQQAEVPTFLYTPSIINDGRRLLITTSPHRFMANDFSDYVDYQSLFAQNSPNQLNMTSLLRMNASFPYIMPTVSMPTKPEIEVFDSGLRDNYGIKTTVNYIYEIRKWLEKNTSGIIVIQIRDSKSNSKLAVKDKKQSLVHEVLSPFGSVYGNWFDVQDYNNEELLSYMNAWYKGDIDFISYELNKSEKDNISLSWHLTSGEKKQIVNSLHLSDNLMAEKKLINLLKSEP